MIGLAFSIFGCLIWGAVTLLMITWGGGTLFDRGHYDEPPVWVSLLVLLLGILSGSFMVAAIISSI